jgi:Secretion system C-terminal sorting domain
LRITDIVLSSLTDSTYIARNFGGRVWPTVANLYNSNRPNIVVGNILGGVQILKNSEGYSLAKAPIIQIYPNPVAESEYMNIKIDRDASVQIVSLLGQRIGEPFLISGNKTTQYRNTLLANGVYLFRFTTGGKSYSKRVVIY